ncbi:hypothetical protein FRB94_010655 [Tulasnella sp. JGI-2019a]|nr:hypothetical protein FRB94_010655 [Tulasnella sp. JGI-2019a]
MRFLIIALALAEVALAQLSLTYTGTPVAGDQLTLSWDGVAPFSLDIQIATDAESSFQEYRTFSSLPVSSAVWNVDVPSSTYVEFIVTDSTGATGSDVVLITIDTSASGAASSSSASVLSQSAASVASTQSVASVSAVSASSVSVTSASAVSASDVLTTITSTSTPAVASDTALADTTSAANTNTKMTTSRIATPTLTNTSASSTGTAAAAQSGSSSKVGPVIGGILGAIIILAIIIFLLRKCFLRRRAVLLRSQMYESGDGMGPGANMVERNSLAAGAAGNHRRTLSRGLAGLKRSDTINWNPDEPHLTPNVAPFHAETLFPPSNERDSPLQIDLGNITPSRSSGVNQYSRYITEQWSPDQRPVELSTDVGAAGMAGVGVGLAAGTIGRSLTTRSQAPPLPPKPEQQPTREPLTIQTDQPAPSPTQHARRPSDDLGGRKSSDSPFADKFSVKGAYHPDLNDVATPSSNGAAPLSPAPRPPRPPRPTRPADLALESSTSSNFVIANPSSPPPISPASALQAARNRLSISNPGPIPTVGHARKISQPIPFVLPSSPPADGLSMPFALHMRDDSRYPSMSPSTSPPSTALLGGVAVGSTMTSGPGMGAVPGSPVQAARSMYPLANTSGSNMPRHPSLRQNQRQAPMGARPMMGMHQRTGSNNSIQQNVRPSSRSSNNTPNTVLTFPSPNNNNNGGPRRVQPPHIPLSPPSRPFARAGLEPDVPTTPTTPNITMGFTPSMMAGSSTAGSPANSLSSIAYPDESSVSSAKIVTATVSMKQPSQQQQQPHPLTKQESEHSRASSINLEDAYGGIDITTTAASPDVTPSPPKRLPLPIETALPYVGGAALSPIAGSPQSTLQMSSPIPSSHLASAPVTPRSRGSDRGPDGPAPPVPSRSNSESTPGAASERMNTVIRREILQGVRAGAAQRAAAKDRAIAAGLSATTPQTPAFFPDRITNYHPTPSPASSSVPNGHDDGALRNVPVDTWSLFDGSSNGGHGGSLNSRHMSANSGRRLSDITAGDAEWKELQRQLKWEQQ